MAKAKTANVEDIPHEIVNTPGVPVSEGVTIDDEISKEIRKFNLADSAIAELKKNYSDLKIADVTDTKGYKLVQEARALVRSKRTGIEKKRQDLKSDYLRIGKGIDSEAARLTALLVEIEEPLSTELKRIDEAKEAARREKERVEQETLQGRMKAILDNGMRFNGSFYVIGETISLDVVTLKNLPEDQFNALMVRVQAENKSILEAAAEAERKAEEERQLFIKQQEEQAAERKRLEDEKKEMERQRAEMRKQRTDFRVQIFQNSGFKMRSDLRSLVFTTPDAGHIFVTFEDFENLEGDAWDGKFSEIKKQAENLKQLQQEKDDELERERVAEEQRLNERRLQKEKEDKAMQELKNLTASRVLQLTRLFGDRLKEGSGGDYVMIFKTHDGTDKIIISSAYSVAKSSDDEWNEEINGWVTEFKRLSALELDLLKEIERKKEEARLAAIGDVDRVDEYLGQLAQIKRPDIKDAKINAAFSLFDSEVTRAIDVLSMTLNAIK